MTKKLIPKGLINELDFGQLIYKAIDKKFNTNSSAEVADILFSIPNAKLEGIIKNYLGAEKYKAAKDEYGIRKPARPKAGTVEEKANQLTYLWIKQHNTVVPLKTTIRQVKQYVKQAIEAGYPGAAIQKALTEIKNRNLSPHQLPSLFMKYAGGEGR